MIESTSRLFTPAEREVLSALIRGGSVTAASQRTGRPISTTRVHMKHLHSKTETHSVGELIVWALRNRDTWVA